jgi:hypothetical protein
MANFSTVLTPGVANTHPVSATFVPAITSGGGTLPTFSSQLGNYVQVGALLFVQVDLDNTVGGTAGAGANQISLTLPMAASAGQLDGIMPAGSHLNGAAEDQLFIAIAPGAVSGLLYDADVVGTNTVIRPFTCAMLNDANTRDIELGFWYHVG